jgi:M6 family metalloprotease-like protein
LRRHGINFSESVERATRKRPVFFYVTQTAVCRYALFPRFFEKTRKSSRNIAFAEGRMYIIRFSAEQKGWFLVLAQRFMDLSQPMLTRMMFVTSKEQFVKPTRTFWTTAAVSLLYAVAVSAMPLHPDLLTQMSREPGRLAQEQQLERDLLSRGINAPRIVPGLRDIMHSHLDENFNIIAILVDFSDKTAGTSASYFDSLLYGNSTGKLRNFVHEITYGNLTLVTVDMPGILGWRRAPQTYAYYVNGVKGFGTYPQNAQRLTEDAVNLVNSVVDFSNYDNDNDGYVDALFVIHAGPGYEYTGNVNDIHSHAWVTSYQMSVDGVYVYGYSMEPEYWISAGDMTCGVYAHEMGHAAFGLPDLYDYGYDSQGLGSWSLMAGGSWNGTRGNSPAHPDAWCRIEMGAATATTLTDNLLGATIPSVESTPTIYRLWTNGASGTEFFLVENRRQTGYDAALPSQGLLIYHIDETQTGNNYQWYPPNHTTSGNYLVALEQADGLYELEHDTDGGDSGDPYPGSTSRRVFDSTSTPGSLDYDSAKTQVAVRNISNSAATMTADLYVTNARIMVLSPNGGEIWYTGESRTLTWSGTNFSGNVKIELNRSYPSSTWETLYSSTANDGSQAWTVSGTVTTQARIRVSSVLLTAVKDTSDANFTIVQPFITVLQPNGGDGWMLGDAYSILWSSGGFTGNVKIELNRSYPSTAWETLFASTANDGSESWTVIGTATQTTRIRISSVSVTSIKDTSNSNFTILGLPPELAHDPLGDIQTGSGSVRVWATTEAPLLISSVKMYYRFSSESAFDSLSLSATGISGEYGASLAALPEGTCEYYIRATDNYGTSNSLPVTAPNQTYSFDIGDLCGAELAYDDGTAERYNYCTDSYGIYTDWAVKFGPVSVPYLLCGARFVISRLLPDTIHDNVMITVFAGDGTDGSPGSLMYYGATGSIGNVLGGLPAGTNWANAIFRDSEGDPLMITTPEFYISISNLNVGEVEALGRDISGVNQHRSFFFDPCEEHWFSEDDTAASENAYPGNRMIRAYGYALSAPNVTINCVSDEIRLFWNGTGATSYNVYAAPTVNGTFSSLGTTADTFFTVARVDTAALLRFFEVRSVIE